MLLHKYNFKVTIVHPKLGGFEIPFSNVSSLQLQKEMKEYKEGGNTGLPEQIIETVRANPIEFSRGMTEGDNLVLDIIQSNFKFSGKNNILGSREDSLFDISVEVNNRQQRGTGKGYTLHDCQITSVVISDFNAMESDLVYVDFTVVFEGVTKM